MYFSIFFSEFRVKPNFSVLCVLIWNFIDIMWIPWRNARCYFCGCHNILFRVMCPLTSAKCLDLHLNHIFFIYMYFGLQTVFCEIKRDIKWRQLTEYMDVKLCVYVFKKCEIGNDQVLWLIYNYMYSSFAPAWKEPFWGYMSSSMTVLDYIKIYVKCKW